MTSTSNQNLWQSESLLSSWTAASLIMLGTALLFYHATSQKTLQVPHCSAAFISCSLIIIDVIFSIMALIPYIHRANDIINDPNQSINKNEEIFSRMYIVIISLYIVIQIVICYYIIRDSIRRKK